MQLLRYSNIIYLKILKYNLMYNILFNKLFVMEINKFYKNLLKLLLIVDKIWLKIKNCFKFYWYKVFYFQNFLKY